MQLLAGTSGFSYREWKGVFYPPELQLWHSVFAFFKHEDAGTGPLLAKQLLPLATTDASGA